PSGDVAWSCRHLRGRRGGARGDRAGRSKARVERADRRRPAEVPARPRGLQVAVARLGSTRDLVRRRIMAGALLRGRILAGGYFLLGAFHHFTTTSQMAHYAALRGVPAPTAAVLVAGVLLLIGGLSLLLGLWPRIGVAALVLFLVPVTLVMHAFWAD